MKWRTRSQSRVDMKCTHQPGEAGPKSPLKRTAQVREQARQGPNEARRRGVASIRLYLAVGGLLALSPALAAETSAGVLRYVQPKPVTVTALDEVSGALFPAKLLPLGFEVGGRLALIKANKGDAVKTGQLLGMLDTEISDAQVAQAEAGLAAAEAGAEMAADVAQRNEKLQAEGSVSDVQSKGAQTSSKQAASQVAMAKAQLAQARAARKRHELKAPFAATIIDAPEQIGMTIGPGMPQFILQQLDPLILKTTIPESSRSQVKVGAKVKVTSVASGVSTDQATVKLVLPSADPATRRVPVEITVPNADGRFVANTLAKANLPMGGPQQALSIPSSALGSTGGEHVFTVTAQGTLKRVPVTVLTRNAKEVTLVSPESMTTVVDYPTSALVDGAKVSGAVQ